MTTRQLYFKVKYLADMPVARMFYTLKDKNGIIQICGGSLYISFYDNMKETFKKIKKAEKTDGFMFWNNSPKGEKWIKNNYDVISKIFNNMILNQK